jgi:hypothetical protein
MKRLLAIIEHHIWYPVALLYICLMAFAVGMILGFFVLPWSS